MNIEAFFKITYGLYVVSTVSKGKKNGFVSNTVFQVTSSPAQVAISCSKNNYTAELIAESGIFSVSILQQETASTVIGTFGYKSGRDTDKFEQVESITGITGAPILLTDTLAWLDCKVVQTVDCGTHTLFIGEMVDCSTTKIIGEPLTYAYYREVKKGKAPKNAPSYIDPAKVEKTTSIVDQYYCSACGKVYDPAEGDTENGIAQGTEFTQLPDNWNCPVCGADKSFFYKKE